MHSRMRNPLLIAGIILLSAALVRAEQFLAGLEDVPVMPGIEVDADAGVAFDSPAGRIVEAYAAGAVSPDAVRSYYRSALPQLGWARTGPLEFRRAGERLTIDLRGESPVTVRFALSPAEQ